MTNTLRRLALSCLVAAAGLALSQAAQAAGLSASTIPALLVEGDNKAGLGYAITKALSEAGINLEFIVGQVVGGKQSTVIGFESGDDARKAVPLIRKAASGRKK